MKDILNYLRDYFIKVNIPCFLLSTTLVAALIAINYTFGLEKRIMTQDSYVLRFWLFFLLFGFTFVAVYFFQFLFARHSLTLNAFFVFLLLAGPAMFAAKVSLDGIVKSLIAILGPPTPDYWKVILNWPAKCAFVLLLVALVGKIGKYPSTLTGFVSRDFNFKPYFILLLCMVPMIAMASTQGDFLDTYPKLRMIRDYYPSTDRSLWQLLFELCYGIDFITIEAFFRGFLVLAFVRYAGVNAVLPMAAFYCTIHFGKPMFECISSYLGGIILGVVVYRTGSVWGGLIIHLGIAWLMELGGYLGNTL